MENFLVKSIGKIRVTPENSWIQIKQAYFPALKQIDSFSHVQIFFWFDQNDNDNGRSQLTCPSPYKNSPDSLGVFATRSPMRPNLIGLTCCKITYIDWVQGHLGLSFIDAKDQTPLLDIKPYTPSLDRVENPTTPTWCSNWPKSLEESANFDWESVLNFNK
jgi:tRNA-Thr(GGU) m(6)t(6)A37 methyltransferase TsaA